MNRIGDYALIGDCHSAALVGLDASIDWACLPRFDSPSVFARILDERRGGAFTIDAAGLVTTSRAYIEDTNVLTTTLQCAHGTVVITDCMPVRPLDAGDRTKVDSWHSILRRIECVGGEATICARIAPRFEYGMFAPRFRVTGERTAAIVGGADSLTVTSSLPLRQGDEEIQGDWTLRAGQVAWLEVAWSRPFRMPDPEDAPSPHDLERRLHETISFWREWLTKCWYDGDHRELVLRSALTLKALTYAPSGAVVAAPTTSLPEEIGGIRNWDYRYTWIRDATLTLISLYVLGFREEAEHFKLWLERAGAGRPEDLQIMYGILGNRTLPEVELEHLSGHRGSAPVRIGNGAVKQMQLDAYGQLLEAGYLFGKGGGTLTEDNWRFLSGLVEIVARKWREPDHGIWEMRDEPRHFVHSKLNCWVALDRGSRVAARLGEVATARRWEMEAAEVRAYLMTNAAPDGWFQQAVGVSAADASTLLVPALGFLPSDHPLVTKTVAVVRRDLGDGALLHRYRATDGLEGGEGAFLLCSFWLIDALTHGGRIDEAEALLEDLLGLANDVGLYGEEVDPHDRGAVGNFPQAFTHMALVLSCAHLSAAKRGAVPSEGAHDYAELALDRLLRGAPSAPTSVAT